MSTVIDKVNTIEGTIDAKSENVEAAADSPISTKVTTVATETKKRKIPSFKEIISKADEKVKRKLVPVQPWDTLKINNVYLIKSVNEMEIKLKNEEKKTGSYICVEDDEENIMNIWISEMILESLKEYSVSDENICIIPLGKKKSKLSGYDYNDFVIVKDDK